MLRLQGILQLKNDGIPNPFLKDFDPNSIALSILACEVMIQMSASGRISQRPRLSLYGVNPLNHSNIKLYSNHPPFAMRPPVQ
ncbi:hypothetical protein HAX54_042804, partial [Datura stramonium]|nr:hypothetical protein [Datura stramonium]